MQSSNINTDMSNINPVMRALALHLYGPDSNSGSESHQWVEFVIASLSWP